jgi:simple sugar transport system ATP-binding protein
MSEIAIEALDIWKEFGHVQALRGASISVHRGEVVALVGDNGAGKSTLMKIMCGALAPTTGHLSVLGTPVTLTSTRDAHNLGVEAVYQDLALAPDLTAAESIFLGHERVCAGWRGRLGIVSRRQMAIEATAALESLGIQLGSSSRAVRDLSGGQRQAVAIARAVTWATQIVLMDEPTAALGTRQSGIVTDTIRRAADRGLGVLVISHDMPRMLKVADRIVVLRLGAVVADLPAANLTIPEIVAEMLGLQEVVDG